MNDHIIGRCSICGGNVVVPGIWFGIFPPTPTCQSCGAYESKETLPEIKMDPPKDHTIHDYGFGNILIEKKNDPKKENEAQKPHGLNAPQRAGGE